VRRGQIVEVVAKHGQLAISMKALALESGASGSLIKLRNLESRKEFSGQILNENKVQVHF
jgi:flagellar basal body P-ring formation protein FlgA